MTDRIAIYLGLIIAALIALDLFLRNGATLVFLGKEMFEFLEWLAFWR
ncbi:hypothetical protein [Maritimibacter dapengensis]|uniref:Glyceraldehyde-3-phosphate dehydrogenase n=1 Tax=Maritimibacter dapengensis TaxID=2836868 RepID=A0ABS6T1Z0_9RHOB|nr:hypothetical protein [Maritimibacter dapengensis]MBV7379267.1 hypothetical protein [Maritimibacter dapengensis]